MGSPPPDMPALEQAIVAWATDQPDILSLAVVGSQARPQTARPADAWSDLDLLFFVDDPDHYLGQTEWLTAIAKPRITFTEPTALQIGRERRVIFDGGCEVDFVFLPAHFLDALLTQPDRAALLAEVAPVLQRGCRILLDRDGRLSRVLALVQAIPLERPPLPTASELDELIQDFWYHTVWTARKLRRGELWVAHRSCDGHLKRLLLRLLEVHAQAIRGVDTWHAGRFLNQWADPRALAALPDTFARYDETAVWHALFATMRLFRWLAEETAAQLGVPYPHDADRYATELVRDLAAGAALPLDLPELP